MAGQLSHTILLRTTDVAPGPACYGYDQVTLHPLGMRYSCPSCHQHVSDNVLFFGDDLSHSAYFVNHNTDVNCAGSSVSDTAVPAESLLLSDGCSSQCKSKVPCFSTCQKWEMGLRLVSWCFKPSQPQRIISLSGL